MAYRSGGRFGPGLTPVVTWLIAATIALFLLFAFAGSAGKNALEDWLLLTPDALLRGHVWTLVTTAFLTRDVLALFLDLLVLWMFVPTLESAWGRRRFLRFVVITTVAGHLAAALFGLLIGARGMPIAGLAPFIYGAIAAFGVAWADQPVQFFGVVPLKAKTVAIGVSAVMLLSVVMNGAWVELVDYAVGIGAGVVLVTSPRTWLLRFRRARLRRSLTVLRGGDDGGEDDPPRRSGGQKWLN
jgi:membrane associated rhomboid family serine protease